MKRAITVTVSIQGKGLLGIPPLQYTNMVEVSEPAILRQVVLAGEFAISDFLKMNEERITA